MLRQFHNLINHPASPKNVQIPFATFLTIEHFMKMLDVAQLSEDEKKAHHVLIYELVFKKNSIRNRQAYTEVVHASGDERVAAFENYINTKNMGDIANVGT